MNNTFVPSPVNTAPQAIRDALAEQWPELTPELRKAATYVLDNPNDVGVSSIREIADAADVKPNTFMRMARSVGFEGYNQFRELFREEIRQGRAHYPDRARWLQSLSKGDKLSALYTDVVGSAIANIENTFARIDVDDLKAASQMIWKSRRAYTLGVGVNHSIAANFTYLASTGMVEFHAIPNAGSVATDDLAWADQRDVLIAITCSPYRREVVEAVRIAREQGVKVIGVSDSAGSPIIVGSDYGFVVSVDTPQFFPSSVGTIALMEALLSFVVASSHTRVVKRVERFHERRHELGLYTNAQDHRCD